MSELTFLGTGTMGLPMARNLITAGFELRVWNRTPDRAVPLLQAGARGCEDPAAAAHGAAIVITMLSDAAAVLETAGQALPTLAPDATWIQMSTIGIEGTERCAELARDAGVTFVDAPVLGTKAPAEQGQLVILASGPESAQSECEPAGSSASSRCWPRRSTSPRRSGSIPSCSSPRSKGVRSTSPTPAPRGRR